MKFTPMVTMDSNRERTTGASAESDCVLVCGAKDEWTAKTDLGRDTNHHAESSKSSVSPGAFRPSLLSRLVGGLYRRNGIAGASNTFLGDSVLPCSQTLPVLLAEQIDLGANENSGNRNNDDVGIERSLPAVDQPSPSIRKFLDLCMGLGTGLGLDTPLREWQQAWSKHALLNTLMAASIPGVVSGKRITDNNSHMALVRFAGPLDWPRIGLDLSIENERYLLNSRQPGDNQIAGAPALEVKRQIHWSVGFKRRPGSHIFACLKNERDASLLSWVLAWRDIGVLRSMTDAFERLLVPSLLSHVDSQDDSLPSFWADKQTPLHEYVLGLSYATDTKGEKHKRPSRVFITDQGSYRKAGRLFVGAKQSFYHCDLTNDSALLPLDSVGLSHGVRHQSTHLSPWCPLSLAIKDQQQHVANNGLQADTHTLGVRITQTNALNKIERTENSGGQKLLIIVDYSYTHLTTKHLDSVNELDLAGVDGTSMVIDLPADRSLPGIYPNTWIMYPRRGIPKLVRTVSLGEALVSHWLFVAAREGGLYKAKSRPAFRNQAKTSTRASESNDYLEHLSMLALTGRDRASLYSSAHTLLGESGTAYRIPIVSIILEEARYLARVSHSDDWSRHSASGPVVRIGANRRSLHIIRLMLRTWFRAGMDSHDIQETIHSMLFDIVSGLSDDIPVRYHLIRVSDEQYRIRALPFWSLSPRKELVAEQKNIFGGAVTIDSNLRAALITNPRLLRMLARQTGLSYRSMYEHACKAVASMGDLAARYRQLITKLTPVSNSDIFRLPEFHLAQAQQLHSLLHSQANSSPAVNDFDRAEGGDL